MMDFNLIEPKLNEIFKTNDVYFSGHMNSDEVKPDKVFQLTTEKIDIDINDQWAKHFPSSNFHISKEFPKPKRMSLIIHVIERDFSSLMYNSFDIKLDDKGIVLQGEPKNLRWKNQ